MARYTNHEKNYGFTTNKKELKTYNTDKFEIVRILNVEEEKEFAWVWFRKGLEDMNCDVNERERQTFEKEWKEKENG